MGSELENETPERVLIIGVHWVDCRLAVRILEFTGFTVS